MAVEPTGRRPTTADMLLKQVAGMSSARLSAFVQGRNPEHAPRLEGRATAGHPKSQRMRMRSGMKSLVKQFHQKNDAVLLSFDAQRADASNAKKLGSQGHYSRAAERRAEARGERADRREERVISMDRRRDLQGEMVNSLCAKMKVKSITYKSR